MICVQGPGSVPHHRPGGDQCRGHPCHGELVVLSVGQRLSELLPHLEVLRGQLEAVLPGAEAGAG